MSAKRDKLWEYFVQLNVDPKYFPHWVDSYAEMVTDEVAIANQLKTHYDKALYQYELENRIVKVHVKKTDYGYTIK